MWGTFVSSEKKHTALKLAAMMAASSARRRGGRHAESSRAHVCTRHRSAQRRRTRRGGGSSSAGRELTAIDLRGALATVRGGVSRLSVVRPLQATAPAGAGTGICRVRAAGATAEAGASRAPWRLEVERVPRRERCGATRRHVCLSRSHHALSLNNVMKNTPKYTRPALSGGGH